MHAAQLIAQTRSIVRRRRALGMLAAAGAIGVAGLLALPPIDAAVGCSPAGLAALRYTFLAIVVAVPLLAAITWLVGAPPADRACAAAEAALGAQQRELTQAHELVAVTGISATLATTAAAQILARLPTAALAQRLPPTRWRTAAIGLGAAVLAALALHLALPDLYPTCIARLRRPDADLPPWSRTSLAWSAAPERVRVGSEARFEITAVGRPEGVPQLLLRSADGHETAVTMFPAGERRWAAVVARVRQPLTAWVAAAGTRTRRHHLRLDPIPVLASVEVVVHAPVYAQLDPQVVRAPATITALAGSMIELVPVANRPLAALVLAHSGGASRRVTLAEGRARLELGLGSWTATPEALDGVLGEPTPLVDLGERPDDAPQVAFQAPSHDAAAVISAVVQISASASDDLGLAATLRARAVNGLEAPRLDQPATGRTATWEQTIDLARLGVAPGDVLDLVVQARDSRPPAGQISATSARRIRIISEADYNRLVRDRIGTSALRTKYGPFVRELRELENAALGVDSGGRPPDLERRALDLLARVRALRRDNPLFALEKQLQVAIEEGIQRVLDGRPGRVGAQLERDLQTLADLAAGVRAKRSYKRFADGQQQLCERLSPLAEHRRIGDAERVRLRELADDQDLLAEKLSDWRPLAERAAAAVETVDRQMAQDLRSLLAAVDEGAIVRLMRQAAQAARSGDGREALRLARTARDRLFGDDNRNLRTCTGSNGDPGFGWADGASVADALDGLGGGGSGAGGLGWVLGYGGDDLGQSQLGESNDLMGPESLGDLGGDQGATDRDLARIAAGGSPARRDASATAARRQDGAGTTARTPLSEAERRLVGEYFKGLKP